MVDDAPSPGDDLRVDAGQSELVRRAQSGDTAAFGQLHRLHAGRVYALCLRLEGDAARADDLTQDVFVRAWERLTSFRGESAFGTWLHRLAVNVVLADRRAAWRRDRRVTLDEEPVALASTPSADPGLALDLEAAIAALPPGARSVFVLHDVEGYQHDEVARLLGIAEGSSKSLLHKARLRLRARLA
jgi:RNA polymerase sigma-70 factor (ECF subfamily)